MEKSIQEDLLNILKKESSSIRPTIDICNKIQNLIGLLELEKTPNWRNLEPKTQLSRNETIVKNQSFRNLNRVSSYDSIKSKGSPTSAPSPRYVSKFHNSEQNVNDMILNTIILSKLNKFSESTYNEIREFLFQVLGSIENSFSNEEFVKEFMNLVFQKAAREEIFCHLYAKLLFEISQKHSIILTEMNKLHENYFDIFTDKENTNKKYKLGYSQFLAELIILRIISSDKLVLLFKVIFDQIKTKGLDEKEKQLIEEYIQCLLRITKVLHNKTDDFFINIKKELLPIVSEIKKHIDLNKADYLSISSKSRFLLMNIYDYLV